MCDEFFVWTALVAAATLFIAWAVTTVGVALSLRPGISLSVPVSRHYPTPALGRTAFLTVTQRRAHWQQAVADINRLIRIRRKFHTLGQYVKQSRIQNLFDGITRRKGVLNRVSTAAIEPCHSIPATPLISQARRTVAVRRANS